MKESYSLRLARRLGHLLSPAYMALALLLTIGWIYRGIFLKPGYCWDLLVGLFLLAFIPAVTGQESFLLRRLDLNQRRRIAFGSFLFCYVVFALYCLLRKTHPLLMAVGLSYLLTVISLLFVNRFFRASGHASALAGPILVFHLMLHGWGLVTLPLLPLMAWARLTVKEHSLLQVIAGFAIGLLSTWGAFTLLNPF